MAIYYYEDQNGKYSSHTDARRFSRVSGKEAYAYLKSAEGKTKRFMKSNDYDDSIVRQMVECIKVYADKHIEVIFGGGYAVEETVE